MPPVRTIERPYKTDPKRPKLDPAANFLPHLPHPQIRQQPKWSEFPPNFNLARSNTKVTELGSEGNASAGHSGNNVAGAVGGAGATFPSISRPTPNASASTSLTTDFLRSKSKTGVHNKLNSSWPVKEKPVRLEEMERELAQKLLQDMIETSTDRRKVPLKGKHKLDPITSVDRKKTASTELKNKKSGGTSQKSRQSNRRQSNTLNLAHKKEAEKQKQMFRSTLVDILIPNGQSLQQVQTLEPIGGEGSTSQSARPNQAEKDLMRYHYYISNGIDTEHVAPMEDSWLQHIMGLVKEPLKKHQETIESLCDEIKEDYLLSVKKAIVDFVLNDPSGEQGACGAGGIQARPQTASQLSSRIKSAPRKHILDKSKPQDEGEDGGIGDPKAEIVVYSAIPSYKHELSVVPKPWEKSFYWARSVMAGDLNVVNPCMNQVLNLWYHHYE
ncbi:uncharacterized protein LOC142347920 [Convolutriloba macropyga]|uniref:uncharacterized protein LOC142347920 n=1 Tax=Convolutriloba macropyga TaxID=536237 RepID=UPI003F523C0E